MKAKKRLTIVTHDINCQCKQCKINRKEEKKEKRISYTKNIGYEIATMLEEKGYEIAYNHGSPMRRRNIHRELNENELKDVIGLLIPREPIQKKFLFFRWKQERLSIFIGRLWLNSERHGASFNKKWVFEVYGNDRLKEITKISKEFIKKYNIDIEIDLADTISRREWQSSDY